MSQRCQSRHFAHNKQPLLRLDWPVALAFSRTPKRRPSSDSPSGPDYAAGPRLIHINVGRRCRHINETRNKAQRAHAGQGSRCNDAHNICFTLAESLGAVCSTGLAAPCPFPKVQVCAPQPQNRPPLTPRSAGARIRPAVRRGRQGGDSQEECADGEAHKTPGRTTERTSVNFSQFLAARNRPRRLRLRFSQVSPLSTLAAMADRAAIEPGLSDPRTFVFFTFLDLVATSASASLTGCAANRAECRPIPSRCSRWRHYCRRENKTCHAKAIAWAIVASMNFSRIVEFPPDRTDITDPAAAEARARPEQPISALVQSVRWNE